MMKTYSLRFFWTSHLCSRMLSSWIIISSVLFNFLGYSSAYHDINHYETDKNVNGALNPRRRIQTPNPRPCYCGRPKSPRMLADKIIGESKEIARINDIPWTAAIVAKTSRTKRPICGATLINDRFVLTAAHCVKGFKADELTIWLNDEKILISNDTENDKSLRYQVQEIIIHPEYRGLLNDIAILRLSDTVNLWAGELSLVNAVCLSTSNSSSPSDYAGQNGTVAGWGLTSPGGKVSEVLLKIQIPILSNEVCNTRSVYKNAIRDSMLCAGDLEAGGKDACQGDSGGPLIVYTKGRAVLVGIVSWGFDCSLPFKPGVYTRVGYFTDWILENTRESNWCHQMRKDEHQ